MESAAYHTHCRRLSETAAIARVPDTSAFLWRGCLLRADNARHVSAHSNAWVQGSNPTQDVGVFIPWYATLFTEPFVKVQTCTASSRCFDQRWSSSDDPKSDNETSVFKFSFLGIP
jgi:hypothetical protein